jgi:hypothetical protein
MFYREINNTTLFFNISIKNDIKYFNNYIILWLVKFLLQV